MNIFKSLTGDSLVSSGLGFIGGLASAFGRNKSIKRQIRAQQEENEKNRQYNFNLAKQQNAWNLEQWNRENAYNTPSAQMNRFKEAGLNPDLAYGQTNLAAASPSLTSGAPSNPADMSALGLQQNLGDVMQNAAQTRLANAQASALESQAKKTDKETEGQNYQNEILASDAKFRDALNQGTIDLNGITLKQGNKNLHLTDEQLKNLRENTANLVATRDQIKTAIDKIKTEISSMNQQQARDWIRVNFERALNKVNIDKIVAETNISKFELEKLKKMLPYEISNLIATTDNLYSSSTLSTANSFVANSLLHTEHLKQEGIKLTNEQLELEISPRRNYLTSQRRYNKNWARLEFMAEGMKFFTEKYGSIFSAVK